MSINSISDLAHQQMLNILGYSSAGQPQSASTNLSIGSSKSNQSSSFAQMLAQLQQMEESNPGQYAKVSQQISTNLSTAASSAQAYGKTSLANQLNTLSKDFSTASQTGQLPNVGDLEKAMRTAGRKTTTDAASSSSNGGSPFSATGIMNQVLSLVGI